ncbi:MAG: 50S ribosomal protein L18 [Deltaproteobacteria bacterium]|nr:50S ribosomal protein L18 [Deltaproteobacteria bacterium]
MSNVSRKKLVGRERRQVRVRKKVFGTAERPRLNVFRSAKHIYAQVINDVDGKTLAAASTLTKAIKATLTGKKTLRAEQVGAAIATRCKELSIDKVVFDRAGYRYHGRIKAIAEAARKAGLQF